MSSATSTSSDLSEKGAKYEGQKIACTAQGCNQKFSNASELAIHKQKHQMTLKLGPSRTGLTDMLPFVVDQTPTPTKFLQAGKETGLFDEISNPFDNEFKKNTTRGESLKEKARRSAVPGLIINNQMNKPRTPTSYHLSSTQGGLPPIGQPVHVITLTPTLPSPVIPGSQLFIPPLPSPQGFLSSPALISPSIVPFSAPGLPFPTVQAVVEHAALTQAFINAAAVVNSSAQSISSHDILGGSQGHMAASRISSLAEIPNSATAPFPTQNVSIPVNSNPTPPSCHAMPVGQNVLSDHMSSASVIQQRTHVMEQRRPLVQSTSLGHPGHPPIVEIMERKPSFHGETSVITQAPAHSSTAQVNANVNMHSANSGNYQYNMVSQTAAVQPFSQMVVDVAGKMASHPALTASRSVPTPPQNVHNHPHPLRYQNSLPASIDAKQKLKETLTNNNPNLHAEIPTFHQQYSIDQELEERNQNEVSSSSGNDIPKTTGKRKGRRTELDPDKKRMRFLERNRAAASRCRAKKKEWVSGLEVKAKEMSSTNIALQNEVAKLKEEVASLKQLLLAHRECPITRLQQQKLATAGGDPSAVVTDPIQAAASLRGIENGEGSDGGNLTLLQEDVETDPAESFHKECNGSIADARGVQVSHAAQMQPSVLVDTSHHTCKSELQTEMFPAALPQVASTSAIVMNNNYNGVPSTLSVSSTT